MSKKIPFTEEQIHVFEQNPYTHSASPNHISFTLEFKQFFVDQIRNHGKKLQKSFGRLVMIPIGLYKEAKAACADESLEKQTRNKVSVLRVAFRKTNRLLLLRQKISLLRKQMQQLKNYRNGLFIWKNKLSF